MKYPEKYKGKKILSFYPYQDEDGKEVYVVGRTEDKDFPIFYMNENRHWKFTAPQINVPYKLPELLAAPLDADVFIVEGEKDAETLVKLGFVATTNRGGSAAGKYFKLWLEYFMDRKVWILPDNDPAGDRHAKAVLELLGPVVKSIQIIRLPGSPLKGDVTDWLAVAGRGAEDLKALVKQAMELEEGAIYEGIAKERLENQNSEAMPGEEEGKGTDFDTGKGWKPFPVAALPPEIGAFATEAARVLSCDPGYTVLACLVAIGGAIGNSRLCMLTEEWFEPSVFWGCLIADNSTTKSPAAMKAKEPIEDLEDEFSQTYEHEVEAFELAWDDWKTRARFDKDGSQDEGGKPAPKKPAARRIKVDDITIEKLAEILFDNPKGLILWKDELAGWFGSFTRYKSGGIGSTDMPFWLEAFRAECRNVDRKGGNRTSIRLKRAAISVYGSIQPETIKEIFSPGFFSSGFVARILFAMPPRQRKEFVTEPIPLYVRTAYRESFTHLYKLDGDKVFDRKHPPSFVRFTPEALGAWKVFYKDWSDRQFLSWGEVGSALAKLEAYCARFAMMFALCDYTAARQPTEDIQPGHVERAFEAVRWFADEAFRVYSMIQAPLARLEENRLVEFIRRHEGKMSVRRLQQSNGARYERKEAAENALEALVMKGMGSWETVQPGPQGGRPYQQFKLNTQRNYTQQNPQPNGVPLG